MIFNDDEVLNLTVNILLKIMAEVLKNNQSSWRITQKLNASRIQGKFQITILSDQT